mgnify:CR=1 FL=1
MPVGEDLQELDWDEKVGFTETHENGINTIDVAGIEMDFSEDMN